jgi:hypothetical protein
LHDGRRRALQIAFSAWIGARNIAAFTCGTADALSDVIVDILMIAISVAFFALGWAYTVACERI